MTGRGGDRAQINFDFAVGVSIVIVTVILAFSFVPGIFGGVTEGRQQSDEVVADRIAENLVERSLEDDAHPDTLDSGCVRALFDTSITACGFTASSVEGNLGIDDRFVSVQVLGDRDPTTGDGTDQLYWDNGNNKLVEGGGSVELAGGGSPGGAQQVGVAKRAVTIDGTPARIVVRVW